MGRRRGRPRGSGKRTAKGRLSREAAEVQARRVVRGNPKAEEKKRVYGTNGADAIGRAYERGLIGGGQNAKAMLDTARSIFRAYWAWYATGPARCALADRTGASEPDDDKRERRQEDWLNGCLSIAAGHGHASRVLFDQLVIDLNIDEGPAWLDRILAATPRRPAHPADMARLNAALDVLAECADVERRGRFGRDMPEIRAESARPATKGARGNPDSQSATGAPSGA